MPAPCSCRRGRFCAQPRFCEGPRCRRARAGYWSLVANTRKRTRTYATLSPGCNDSEGCIPECKVSIFHSKTYLEFLKARVDAGVVAGGQNNGAGIVCRGLQLVDHLAQLADRARAVDDLVTLLRHRRSFALLRGGILELLAHSGLLVRLNVGEGLVGGMLFPLMFDPGEGSAQQRQSFARSSRAL